MNAKTGTALTDRGADRAVFARMRSNVLWLLGGRGFQAVSSLAYLGIAARAMGPHGFGEFSLALAYGQAIANLAQFQSWQGVIRYGALHMATGDEPRLARLLGFTATLDWASALGGAVLAALGVMLIGPLLEWSDPEQQRAALFGAALLLSIGATPAGILRLLDRFDLITYCQAIGPAVRLVGSIAAWFLGGGVGAFLAVWASAALLQSAATWAVALGRSGRRISVGRRGFGRAVAENSGIWRFMLVTNASSSLGLLLEQVGTLAIGGMAGATAAGGFRLAAKVARALGRPIEMLARVLYPELARLLISKDQITLEQVMARTRRISFAVAVLMVLVAGFGGPLLLQLLAGHAYRFAHLNLFLLAIAAAIDLSGVGLEPLLTARGQVSQVLRIRMAGGAIYIAGLIALLPIAGPVGVAFATIAASLAMRVWLAVAAGRSPDRN